MHANIPGHQDLQNIIPIDYNANFFFERAVKSLDRFQYGKALKYFRKAVEYEPDNPVNHCNMAGILSETGDYEGSNRVLKHILDQVDSSMTECHFYMANNYANLEQFEEAEQALITYLEEDSSGQFMDEAEEMMELLHYELNRPTKVNKIKSREGMVEHEQARALLEEGKFAQAAKLLETIVEDCPDFMSARNNLALAFYYMGRFAKAKEVIGDVLDKEPGNLHALCNLAIFYQHEKDEEGLHRLLDMLSVTVPFHQEHVFKLATTMGILGRHEAAYGHFRRLTKDEEFSSDASLYHYTAVAACNSGRMEDAVRYWRQCKRLDPANDVADFYLAQLDSLQESDSGSLKVSYHYHLPFEEQFKVWEHDGAALTEEAKSNPLIRSSFFWALRHGEPHIKLQVIQTLELIADEEVQHALHLFLQEPGEDVELKAAAELVLTRLEGASGREAAGEMPSDSLNEVLPEWHKEWQQVLDLAVSMGQRQDPYRKREMERLWSQFLSRMYPDLPKMRNLSGWAAALDYTAGKLAGDSYTYEKLAERYQISSSTVRRYARQLAMTDADREEARNNFRPFTEKS
ncbi:tetratricopeptide repeat protein [Paenibacillus sp. F411]|uniref:tetratricopeptide repeat protein n=1 Tax=Paenibacillus sp. F411 TaxID=2820239 RepID=UPI001AAF7B58|nr:tetratricopeptide repeat protein [Paenibacillus sp. F411]MBO2945417.1 tetratricopeptide repeat protein [Paenibacillus sp. F411]